MTCVSVIVPMYNVEPFIGECIASLRGQTLGDFQAVCVNDGSTDLTAVRAREAAGNDERFVFVDCENRGLSAARNRGLSLASGDYVSFLDSDDWYKPQTLEVLYAAAVADDLDVLDFSASTIYESKRVRKMHEEVFDARRPIDGVLSGPDIFVRYWQSRDYISSACFHLIKREYLQRAGLSFPEGLLHEDELFTSLLYAQAERVAFLNEPFYCRRMREHSIMTVQKSLLHVTSLFTVSRLMHAWIVEHAESYDAAFLDAFTWAIANVRDAAYRAAREIDPAQLQAYIDGLDAQDRVDFDLTVRYVCDNAQERYLDVSSSRGYKLGNALVAAPRYLRDNVLRKAKVALAD